MKQDKTILVLIILSILTGLLIFEEGQKSLNRLRETQALLTSTRLDLKAEEGRIQKFEQMTTVLTSENTKLKAELETLRAKNAGSSDGASK